MITRLIASHVLHVEFVLHLSLIQVHLEVQSQTRNLIGSNDRLDSPLELALGIESLKLVQILS